jgi:hypothetical protein
MLAKVMKNNITFFDRGGHLGYFCNSIFQTNFIRALNGSPIKNDVSDVFPVRAETTNLTFKINLVSRKANATEKTVTNITELVTKEIKVDVNELGTNNSVNLPPASTATIIRVTINPHSEDKPQKKETSEQDGIILETIEE